eukprot:CAMPEP_0168204138 /NCGR_PEP_ID=MMETSP0139_2-20121125/25234_1 /TAXON_ID=44445 /ORGANISM="Pseudo-nitzschia australis, Strain 10249 10 AB" /LENGTH=133 /DNA_ID=CAMNT_0008130049 /DNA_START=447 /DNA_END=848 /DNA_ORIENTATION=+
MHLVVPHRATRFLVGLASPRLASPPHEWRVRTGIARRASVCARWCVLGGSTVPYRAASTFCVARSSSSLVPGWLVGAARRVAVCLRMVRTIAMHGNGTERDGTARRGEPTTRDPGNGSGSGSSRAGSTIVRAR